MNKWIKCENNIRIRAKSIIEVFIEYGIEWSSIVVQTNLRRITYNVFSIPEDILDSIYDKTYLSFPDPVSKSDLDPDNSKEILEAEHKRTLMYNIECNKLMIPLNEKCLESFNKLMEELENE
jgi:hypothetical protein